MTKNIQNSQNKEIVEVYEYPERSTVSKDISKMLEAELQTFVTQYSGWKSFQFDLTVGAYYPSAVEQNFSRIIQQFIIDMTKDWPKDKLNQFNQSLRGNYAVGLSRELMNDLENVTKIDFWYYKDFWKQIPYLIIPKMIDGIEKVLASKTSSEVIKPAETARNRIAKTMSQLLHKKVA